MTQLFGLLRKFRQPGPALAARPSHDRAAQAAVRVLVVEDNGIIALDFSMKLEGFGAEVVGCARHRRDSATLGKVRDIGDYEVLLKPVDPAALRDAILEAVRGRQRH